MHYYDDIAFRPVEKKDLESIRRLRNDQTTWIYLTDATLVTPAMQEQWFEKISQASDAAYFTVVKIKREFPILYEDDFLGIIRMDEYDANNRSARIGCDIIPEMRGKGYGTKAFRACMKYFFHHIGLHRLWLCVLDNNMVAQKLYSNVGFKEEGRLRDAVWRDGKYHDYIVMGILDHEYREKK